jgi:phenylalanyl-tRNA synthetase beta chain
LVLNPLTSEGEALRMTALASLLETVRANLRHTDRDVDLFEIGRVYLPRTDDLPDERRVITIAMGGFRSGRLLGDRVTTDFYDLKGAVEALLSRFGIANASFVPVTHPTFHPGRAALVVLAHESGAPVNNDNIAGIVGEVSRDVADAFDIEGQRAYLATLDVERLIESGSQARAFSPLPKYPPVMQDIAVIVDQGLPAVTVEGEARRAGGELVRDVRLFDVYEGPPVPQGKKSLAYAITYQSADHTLTDKEVKAVHDRIERALTTKLGAHIRGEQ